MEFRESAEDAAFRAEVRGWLAANKPPPEPAEGPDKARYARDWQRRLWEGGWAGIAWPQEYGGRGLGVVQQLIFNEEYALARAPDILNLKVGLSLVGPTLIHCGEEWQRKRFLPKLLSGEEMWCQGFSEPNAGSDLASLRTRAELDGDELVVNGQKTWTSFARWADWCILVVRTSSEGPRHKGLTFLLLDMKSPGITIRPLVEMTGHAWFNEVFFDNVRVPLANVVGGIGNGWNVVVTTLGHERSGTTPYVRLAAEQRRLARLARRTLLNGAPAARDPLIRQKIAQHAIDVQTLKCTTYRNITALRRTGTPGPESSVLKLFWSELDQRLKETAIDILGARGLLRRDDPLAAEDGFWFHELLWSRAATIYAGTSEVQRNIVAQRVLGLPR